MSLPDVCIAGAGIIGLSLALELHQRGLHVTVLDRAEPLAEASTAAAGMLAAANPLNPPQLHPLADLSRSLYPQFLEQIQTLSGMRVPVQTHLTLQALPPGVHPAKKELTPRDLTHLLAALTPGNHHFVLLDEPSLDPRQLAEALLAAIRATSIQLLRNTPVIATHDVDDAIEVHTPDSVVSTKQFVDCTGAWTSLTSTLPAVQVYPRKGQMLAVSLPFSLPLRVVVRTPEIYIVPRTSGPNAGQAVIGATVEDAGFDKEVHSADITRLRALASTLLHPLAYATQREAWAGLRPATADGLPVLGSLPPRSNYFVASGHYRDGILLAPATARVIAQLLIKEVPSIDLTPFSPARTA